MGMFGPTVVNRSRKMSTYASSRVMLIRELCDYVSQGRLGEARIRVGQQKTSLGRGSGGVDGDG